MQQTSNCSSWRTRSFLDNKAMRAFRPKVSHRHTHKVSASSTGSSSSSGPVVRVDGLVVQPAYRSTPWDAEERLSSEQRDKALLLFVSESGICRAPLAAALFQQQLQQSPLRDWITVEQRATRDYCLSEPPDPAAVAAAHAFGIHLQQASHTVAAGADTQGMKAAAGAQQFDPATDIVAADLVLVMDKYTAADVLREVSSYDLINPGGHYSARVRLLGSYHPRLAAQASRSDGQDIDDPLYGNVGGEEQQAAVLAVAHLLKESCSCLIQQLEQLAEAHGLLDEVVNGSMTACTTSSSQFSTGNNGSLAGAAAGAKLRAALVQSVRQEGVISWLVPPMLQGSNTDMDGWV